MDWYCKHENWHPLGHFPVGMGSEDTMWILCDDCGRYGQIHFRPSFDTKGSPTAKNMFLKLKKSGRESGGLKLFDAETFEAIEFREMPQLSARDEDLAKQIAALYQEMAQLFEDGELTKAIEKEFDEDIENIFNQMSPEAQNPWGAETFEAPLVGKGAVMDIGKNTDLGAFTTSELTTSSAIHGDFEEASLGYSGHQNIAVRKAETIDSPSSTIPSWATQSLLVDALVVITGLGLGFFGVRELKKKELAWLVL